MFKKKTLLVALIIFSMLISDCATVLAETVEIANEVIEARQAENQVEEVIPEISEEPIQVEENIIEAEEPVAEEVNLPSEEPAEEVLATEETAKDEAKDLSETVFETPEIRTFNKEYTSKDGNTYEVTVVFGANANIPENAKISVKEFEKTSQEFAEAKEAVLEDNAKKGETVEEDTFNMVALDISILDENGVEIEPDAAVSVDIKIKKLAGQDLNEVMDSVKIKHHREIGNDIVIEKVNADKKIKNNSIDMNFTVTDFSTYTIEWTYQGNRTTTVHYGYMNGNTFVEFEQQPSPVNVTERDNGFTFLIYDFRGYNYTSTYYATSATNNPRVGTQSIVPKLEFTRPFNSNTNRWRYTTTQSAGNTWNDVANNSHIYVIYERDATETEGGEPIIVPITPQNTPQQPTNITKSSEDNGDGTRTISLSLTGHQNVIEPEAIADVIVVMDVSGSMSESMSGSTRMQVAKDTVNDMADKLLGENKLVEGDIVRMALVTFSNEATLSTGFTSDVEAYKSAVNSMSPNGGTNWNDALDFAEELTVESDRETFIIFVTDGEPTFRNKRKNATDEQLQENDLARRYGSFTYYNNSHIFGNGNTDPYGYNYDAALVQAKQIVDSNKIFYTIGISDSDTGLAKLAQLHEESGSTRGAHYTASEVGQLEAAFDAVIQHILEIAEEDVGWSPTLVDGITELTNLQAKAPLVGVSTSSFKYYKQGPDDANPVEWNPTSEGAATAVYDETEGAVIWDLGTNHTFEMEDDTTYTVSFLVWPSQQAIDYVTQLNNHEIDYDSLPADVKEQITETSVGSGVYVLATNTDQAYVTYQLINRIGGPDGEIEVLSDPIKVPFNTVDPLDLDTMELKVVKIFNDTLTNGEDRQDEVTLHIEYRTVSLDSNGNEVYGAWQPYNAFPTGTGTTTNAITLNDSNNWQAKLYVSPGFQTEHGTETIVYNTGYQYRLTEPNIDYHYEINSEIIKPMLVNMDEYKYYGDTETDTTAPGYHALTAENVVKGGLNITKTLKNQDDETITNDNTVFKIHGKIVDAQDHAYINDPSNINCTGAYHVYDANGNRIKEKQHFDSTEDFVLELKAGETVRFINLPQGSKYEFYEMTDELTTGYSYVGTTGNSYTVDEQGQQVALEFPTVSTTGVATGTIQGNDAHYVNITNQTTTTNITVNKIWDDKDNQDGARPILTYENGVDAQGNPIIEESEAVHITLKANGSAYQDVYLREGNNWQYKFEDLPTMYNGQQISYTVTEDTITDYTTTYGNLVPVTENGQVTGYTLDVTNKHDTETVDVNVTKIWQDNNDQDGYRPPNIKVQLYAAVGNETPVAVNDPVTITPDANGNWKYQWTKLDKYRAVKQEITYSVKEVGAEENEQHIIYFLNNQYVVTYGQDNTGLLITNTHELETVSVSVEKDWQDSNNQDGLQPDSITVQLLANGDPVTQENIPVTKTLDANSSWQATWTGLYKKSDKVDITYTVKEVGETNNQITFNGGIYTVAYQDTSTDDAISHKITNTHEPLKTEIVLEGTKSITGRDLTNSDTFEFTITEVDANGNALTGDKAYSKTVNNDSDKITFPTIEYTNLDAGLHYYQVTETSVNENGITSDPNTYTVVVEVKLVDNDSGMKELTATIKDTSDALAFVNTYNATGSIELEVSKALTGRTLENGQFTFEIAGQYVTTNTATNDADGKVKFAPISYTEADVGKTYTYTITERNAGADGYEYDGMQVQVPVTITDNGNGTLTATPEYPSDIEFNNTYEATGSIELEVTKALAGRTLENGQFTFEIAGQYVTTNTATNDADGKVKFAPISYTEADVGKTYTYTITEKNLGADGYTYDGMQVQVPVTITDNGNGKLTATPDYPSDVEFNNTYEASGSIELEVTKVLAGRALQNGQFTFEIAGQYVTTNTATNDADGKVKFAAINYTEADIGKTYTYTITERNAGADGYEYDGMQLQVPVTITDNGNGKLTATPDYPSDVEFNNTYTASGSIELEVTKALAGRTLENGQFTFEISGQNVVTNTATNDADGNVKFAAINYTEADAGKTYTYTITERNDSADGYSYDGMQLQVPVTITDNGNGKLTATPDYPSDVEFNNTYTATGSIILQVTKQLEGRVLEAGQFTFKIAGQNVENDTATNDADGNVIFGQINYTEADIDKEYTYTITEVDGGQNGYYYDNSEFKVKVKVTDNGNGKLTATPEYPEDTEFNNTYSADGKVVLEAKKALEGRTLEDGQFKFDLADANGVIETVTNDAEGNIKFGMIKYDQDDVGKKFTYTITEQNAGVGGYTYDNMTIIVDVEVTDNGDGTLTATPSYPFFTTFNNTYEATGSIELEVTKALAGRALEDGQFTFEISGQNVVTTTATNDANGNVKFAQIDYTEADAGKTYTYTITEKNAGADGYEYDGMQLQVPVTITDNGNGKLTATPDYPSDVEFNNTYTATGSIELEVTKALAGRALEDGQFTFEIAGQNVVTTTATNDANGNVKFAQIDYTEADAGKTYTYTITEKAAGADGYTYDGMQLQVPVTITDNGNGKLTATPDYPSDVEFNNTYEATGYVTLEVTKALAGRALEDGQFEFIIAGPNVIEANATATNDANGKVTFETINYTEADAGKTYTYTITEKAAGADGYTYDGMQLQVPVTITDNGNGKLTATPDYPSDVEFNNTYEATGYVTLEVTKALAGRALEDGQFEFTIAGPNVIEANATATNDANGKVTFETINYTEADAGKTYTYTITEKNAGADGYEYDGMQVKVPVTITDNGNGKLTATPDYPSDVEFNNTYTATGSIELEVTKALAGRTLEDGQFTFEISGQNVVTNTATNDANGNVKFAQIDYTEADAGKTYTYTITEKNTGADGYTFDGMQVQVPVTITDNGNGKLTATPDYPSDVEFNNTYKATGSVVLEVTKALTGRALEDGQFTFEIAGQNVVTTTATNDANGKVEFAEINYTEADAGKTYTYTITEKNTGADGYEFDGMQLQVPVTITDNGNGKLTATPDYPSDVEFNNTYKATGNVVLEVTKALTGRALEDGQFTFRIEGQNVVTNTATNDANGKVEFAQIDYTEADAGKTYTYTITEQGNVVGGYTYDSMKVEVPVTITDNGNGKLTATPDYPEDTEFNNTYNAEGKTTFEATKVLEGRNLVDGQFDFELRDSEGQVVETVSNDAEGNIKFSEIVFTEKDLDKDISYTISEVVDKDLEDQGYVFDDLIIDIDIELIDNGDGTITVNATCSDDTEFNNIYQTINITVIKVWEDAENWDNLRPASIEVQLFANGQEAQDPITLNEENEWTFTWEGLDLVSKGEDIEYSVEELVVPEKYSVEYSVDEEGNLIITNTQIPGEGGYEPPPENPGTGTSIFDNVALYISMIIGALGAAFIGTKKYLKKA